MSAACVAALTCERSPDDYTSHKPPPSPPRNARHDNFLLCAHSTAPARLHRFLSAVNKRVRVCVCVYVRVPYGAASIRSGARVGGGDMNDAWPDKITAWRPGDKATKNPRCADNERRRDVALCCARVI